MNTLNKRELASVLNISERALTDWHALGLPIAVAAAIKGESHAYDLPAVARWLAARLKAREGLGIADDGGESFSNARVRKERAAADLLELDRCERSGRLVDAVAVRKAAFELAHAAQQTLMTIPDRIASILAAENDPGRTHDLLTLEISRVCNSLATPQ